MGNAAVTSIHSNSVSMTVDTRSCHCLGSDTAVEVKWLLWGPQTAQTPVSHISPLVSRQELFICLNWINNKNKNRIDMNQQLERAVLTSWLQMKDSELKQLCYPCLLLFFFCSSLPFLFSPILFLLSSPHLFCFPGVYRNISTSCPSQQLLKTFPAASQIQRRLVDQRNISRKLLNFLVSLSTEAENRLFSK